MQAIAEIPLNLCLFSCLVSVKKLYMTVFFTVLYHISYGQSSQLCNRQFKTRNKKCKGKTRNYIKGNLKSHYLTLLEFGQLNKYFSLDFAKFSKVIPLLYFKIANIFLEHLDQIFFLFWRALT